MSEETLVKGAVLHGTYELVDLLGRGGMGAVWRARHLRLPRPVAIKVLHEHAYESTEILQRFRREAEITSQLGHPHIVEVSDFNVLEDGRAYLVMELLEGVSLRQRLRDGRPFSLDDVGLLLGQVSSALSRAHRAGVVHRDLKPENIFLVDHDGTGPFAKVLDFGISKMQGAETVLTQGASLMGTPRYMSPEQARGDNASVDGRADQFSVGAIAYECLSGRPAFAGSSVTQVLLQVLEEDPEPLGRVAPEVPPALAAVVHRALGKERDGRFPSMDAFREALGLALGSEVGTFTPTPRGARADTEPEAYEDTVLRPGADSEGTRREPGEGRRKVPIWAVLAVLALGLAAGVVVSLSILGPDPIDIVAVD
ncbi:MAG: serine/threonine-protein kinase, partial [Myxococcota bacterium]